MLPVFTVFDVETTGLDPSKGHKIVEIAGVRIEDGIITEKTFVELVNPEREIPPEAAQVNKIRNEDIATADTIDQVLPRFLDFASGSILVAHNAPFDMGFLEIEKQCCWGFIDLPECICTLRLSRNLYPEAYGHALHAVATRLGLSMPETLHRALPDVLLTADALIKMLSEHGIEEIEELRRRAGIKQLVN